MHIKYFNSLKMFLFFILSDYMHSKFELGYPVETLSKLARKK